MNRLKMQCPCCRCEVELLRDHISGPDHFRCGNCFEIVDVSKLDDIAEMNKALADIEEKRNAILATYR